MSVTEFSPDDPTLPNRYLAGQLSDAECARFEDALARNPQMVRDLEATARLKVGLARLRDKGELARELRPRPFFMRPMMLALAASVLAVFIAVSWIRGGGGVGGSRQPLMAASLASIVDQRGGALAVGSTAAVFRTRANSYDATVELPPAGQALELRVLPERQSPSGEYQVSLMQLRNDDTAEPVASVEGLRPTADGFVVVFADATHLVPGRYRLTITDGRASAQTLADSFLLRVVAGPNSPRE